MENIIDAIDNISKVAKILDFLSNEIKDEGLSFILDSCCQDLAQVGLDLETATQGPEA